MMGKVLSFDPYRRKRAEEKGLKDWTLPLFRSIGEFEEHTRWADLPDEIILFFCEEWPSSKRNFHDMLMGANLDWNGNDSDSPALDRLAALMNVYFFLTDQAQFECMRRLGWIYATPGGRRSIIEAVMDSGTREYWTLAETPELTPAHPAYEEDRESKGLDRAVLVRKYNSEAVAALEKRLGMRSAKIR
jgi:hypothetical protein